MRASGHYRAVIATWRADVANAGTPILRLPTPTNFGVSALLNHNYAEDKWGYPSQVEGAGLKSLRRRPAWVCVGELKLLSEPPLFGKGRLHVLDGSELYAWGWLLAQDVSVGNAETSTSSEMGAVLSGEASARCVSNFDAEKAQTSRGCTGSPRYPHKT